MKLDMGFINGLLPVFGAEHLQSTPEQVKVVICFVFLLTFLGFSVSNFFCNFFFF